MVLGRKPARTPQSGRAMAAHPVSRGPLQAEGQLRLRVGEFAQVSLQPEREGHESLSSATNSEHGLGGLPISGGGFYGRHG